MKHIRVQFQYTFPYVVSRSALILILGLSSLAATSSFAGTVILNGKDVSSARNQELKNVNVFINDRGEVYITAPHYQVLEEQTYVPLRISGTKAQAPMHQEPRELISAMKDKPKEAVDAPIKKEQAPDESNKIQQPASGTPANVPAPQANATGTNSEKPAQR